MNKIKILLTISIIIMLSSANTRSASCWSNNGYSDDPSQPKYGTHDWIAQHALDYLPSQEKQYIIDNLAIYLYGTELPDNNQAEDGIGDTTKHHVYFYANGSLQDNASAVRAADEYQQALSYLKDKDYQNAAKTAGIMTHYIADVAVFGHVMGANTDWQAEKHHSDYETHINKITETYDSSFATYLYFDGALTDTSAYNATMNLAYDTTFGGNKGLTCIWMDNNYNWNNSDFVGRAGESVSLAVNIVADVLHTLYTESQKTTTNPESPWVQILTLTVSVSFLTALLATYQVHKKRNRA